MRAEMIESLTTANFNGTTLQENFRSGFPTHAFALTVNFERMTTVAIKTVFSSTGGRLSVSDDSHHDLMIATSSDRTMLLYAVVLNSCRSKPHGCTPESLRARTMAKFIGTNP
jgi:hypothetical protein